MSRYIDENKLIKDLDDFYTDVDCRWQRGRNAGFGINIAKQIIENQPTADVQEVNKDIPKKRYKIWYKYAYFYRCSKCKIYVDKDCKYCPNCGQAIDWS